MKRVIFERPGDLPPVILGHLDGQLPETIENVVLFGVELPLITLVRVTTRAAYYRTPLVPTSAEPKTFNPAQR